MISTEWKFNEFLAFLLIYASHADIDFSDDEKEDIKKTVSTEIFDNMYSHFKTLTDYQALELILSYRELYFSSPEEKELLFVEMRKLFLADGDFSILEKELLVFLEKLM